MDYSSQEEPHPSRQPRHHHDHKASPTELLSDAQLLAGAAFNRKAADKAKLAGAAEDLLAAASEYGKLDQGSYGTYIDKAEGFLHKYHSGGSESDHASSNPTKTQHSAPRPKREEEEEYYEEEAPRPMRKKKEEDYEEEAPRPSRKKKEDDYEEDYEEAAPRPSRKKKEEDEEEESGGGFGDYLKIAQGFLKK